MKPFLIIARVLRHGMQVSGLQRFLIVLELICLPGEPDPSKLASTRNRQQQRSSPAPRLFSTTLVATMLPLSGDVILSP